MAFSKRRPGLGIAVPLLLLLGGCTKEKTPTQAALEAAPIRQTPVAEAPPSPEAPNEDLGPELPPPGQASFILGSVSRGGNLVVDIGGKFIVKDQRLWLWMDSISYQHDRARPTLFMLDSLNADTLLELERPLQDCSLGDEAVDGSVIGLMAGEEGVAGHPRTAWKLDLKTLRIRRAPVDSVTCTMPEGMD